MRWLLLLIALASPLHAEGEKPGTFDYYVLSISWSPNWCAYEGNNRGSPQCDADPGFGWVLHGLWPQYEAGWPSYCPTRWGIPAAKIRKEFGAIMGDPDSASYQWRKHGSCSGYGPVGFFDRAKRAFQSVTMPESLTQLGSDRISAAAVENAFLAANPELEPDMITITCKSGMIQEARICLTKDLEPRVCGTDVRRDCRATSAEFFADVGIGAKTRVRSPIFVHETTSKIYK